ncbi:transposase [Mesorhizobium sp. SP-1A]|uniref:transposase n=1 Tax=Mesorhizobium sp. SP-1A TaxID=3077840 RepID=UPI0028F72102|nr:transposase [Mesorhizobium sp. SP-1A]
MTEENNVDHEKQSKEAIDIKPESPVAMIEGKKPISVKPATSAKVVTKTSRDRSKILDKIASLTENGKHTLKKALQQAGISKRTYYTWKKDAPRVEAPAKVNPEMSLSEEIVQLEAENKRYRKMLADKLRVENADLRKRLAS